MIIVSTLIRLIFWTLVILGSLWLIKKSRLKNKKRARIISVMLGIALWTVSGFFLVTENVFVTFPSPEAAYQYTHTEGPPYYTVSGSHTDMVIGISEDNTCVWRIFPRTEGGWRVGSPFDVKTYWYAFDDGIMINVDQHKKTGDCYLWLVYPYALGKEVYDSNQSVFYISPALDPRSKSVAYYAYVGDIDENYVITVNGTDYKITGAH